MAKKKERTETTEVRKIAKELGELIDLMKLVINDYAWHGLKISDADASRVLANKIKESGLVKKP